MTYIGILDSLTVQGAVRDKETETPKLNNEYLDAKAASKYLKISTRTLKRYRDKGFLKFSRPGRKTFYKLNDLREFMRTWEEPAFAKKGGVTNG